ncbi:PIG-L family deacetylase [bacterium]|nr:PIG-L family deacetylase [bacterium]
MTSLEKLLHNEERPTRVLALGAHPDDIEIGCAGTLLRFVEAGAEVNLYIATEGQRGGAPEMRVREAERAADKMKVKEIFWGDFMDCEIPHGLELIQSIEKAIKAVAPDFLFVHYFNDTHQDHRAMAGAAQSAGRRVPNFLFFESPTTQHFAPYTFCNINTTITQKIELLETHFSQVARTNIDGTPITDIARAMAIHRGMDIYTRYAEAFLPTRLTLFQ